MGRSFVFLALLSVLAGCGGFSDSRLNPLNWFGGGKSEPVQIATVQQTDPAFSDTRPLIASVRDVVVERAAGGAILRVSGLASAQGFYGAELVPLAGETPINGALVYFFRVEPPLSQTPIGPDQTRIVTAARFLPDDVLSQARSVVVRSQSNQVRSSR